MMNRKKRIWLIIILIILLFLSVFYSLTAGSISISFKEFFADMGDKESLVYRVVWDLRLPRILVGLLVGMCLAVSGAILQGVMKNPLADPGIIGVTSGAGLAATVIMVLYPDQLHILPLAAFLGAFLTAMLIYLLAWQDGTSIVRIMLVGISINAFLGAIMSCIMILHSDKVQAVLPWLNGGISGVSWVHVEMIVYYAIFALALAFFSIKHIRMLMLGDEVATLLGHQVERSRFFLIFCQCSFSWNSRQCGRTGRICRSYRSAYHSIAHRKRLSLFAAIILCRRRHTRCVRRCCGKKLV